MPETGFVNTGLSIANLNLKQGTAVIKPVEASTMVEEVALGDAVKTGLSDFFEILESFVFSILLQCQCGLERLFGNLSLMSFMTSVAKQVKASVNISVSTMVWMSLSVVIGFLGFTRPKSALTD
jgi:hypothetical protein